MSFRKTGVTLWFRDGVGILGSRSVEDTTAHRECEEYEDPVWFFKTLPV